MPTRIETTRLDAKTIRRDANGFVKLPARTTRVGVFTYRKADGSVLRELRHPDEVFKADSMATLASIPITNDHPDRLLCSKTARQHAVGFTGEKVEIGDGRYLDTTATIYDEETIIDIQKGKEELSLGYSCDLDFTPGEFEGISFDCVQRNIKYNHLSVVDRGRAGPTVKLRMDAEDAVLDDDQTPQGGKQMAKLKVGDQEFDASQELCDAFNKQMDAWNQKQKTEMDAVKDQAKADGEKLAGDLKAAQDEQSKLQAKLDTAEEQLKARTDAADPAKIQELVKARVQLEKVAVAVKPEAKLDAADLDLMKEVIMAKSPTAKLDGRDAVYIRARFDAIAENVGTSNDAIQRLGEKIAGRMDKATATESTAAEAKARSEEASRTAWNKPLGGKKEKA